MSLLPNTTNEGSYPPSESSQTVKTPEDREKFDHSQKVDHNSGVLGGNNAQYRALHFNDGRLRPMEKEFVKDKEEEDTTCCVEFTIWGFWRVVAGIFIFIGICAAALFGQILVREVISHDKETRSALLALLLVGPSVMMFPYYLLKVILWRHYTACSYACMLFSRRGWVSLLLNMGEFTLLAYLFGTVLPYRSWLEIMASWLVTYIPGIIFEAMLLKELPGHTALRLSGGIVLVAAIWAAFGYIALQKDIASFGWFALVPSLFIFLRIATKATSTLNEKIERFWERSIPGKGFAEDQIALLIAIVRILAGPIIVSLIVVGIEKPFSYGTPFLRIFELPFTQSEEFWIVVAKIIVAAVGYICTAFAINANLFVPVLFAICLSIPGAYGLICGQLLGRCDSSADYKFMIFIAGCDLIFMAALLCILFKAKFRASEIWTDRIFDALMTPLGLIGNLVLQNPDSNAAVGTGHTKREIALISTCSYCGESREEMRLSLSSLFHQFSTMKSGPYEFLPQGTKVKKLEAHVTVDDALNDNYKPNDNLQQFFELLEMDFGFGEGIMECAHREETYFGLRYTIPVQEDVNLVIFAKNCRTSPMCNRGKRWNQNLMFEHIRVRFAHYDTSNVFILLVDGDTVYNRQSIELLLLRGLMDPHLGGVCGRFESLGNAFNPLVIFQRLDYSLAHFQQKSGEAILGNVFCLAGAFSLIRLAVLTSGDTPREVAVDPCETPAWRYAKHAEAGIDALRLDMGEDRHLTTLIIKNGYRTEYMANAVAGTHVPTDFRTFFNQRRRWQSSTFINTLDVILASQKILLRNKSHTVAAVLFTMASFFIGLLAPATMCLAIAGSLWFVFSEQLYIGTFFGLFIPIAYVVFCYLSAVKRAHDPPAMAKYKRYLQFQLAYFLSVIYAITVAGIIIGLAVQIGVEIVGPIMIYLVLQAVFILLIALVMDLSILLSGIVYLFFLPMAALFLQIYTYTNMNDLSWGTRDVDGGSATKEPGFREVVKAIIMSPRIRVKWDLMFCDSVEDYINLLETCYRYNVVDQAPAVIKGLLEIAPRTKNGDVIEILPATLVAGLLKQATGDDLKTLVKVLKGLGPDSEIKHWLAMSYYKQGNQDAISKGDAEVKNLPPPANDREKANERQRSAERILCWEKILRKAKGENFENNAKGAIAEAKNYVSKPPSGALKNFLDPIIVLFDTMAMFNHNGNNYWVDYGLDELRKTVSDPSSLLSHRIDAVQERTRCIQRRLGVKHPEQNTLSGRLSSFVEYQVINNPSFKPDGDSLDNLQKNTSIVMLVLSMIWIVMVLSLAMHSELSVDFSNLWTPPNNTASSDPNNVDVPLEDFPPEFFGPGEGQFQRRSVFHLSQEGGSPSPAPTPEHQLVINTKARHNVLGLALFIVGAIIVLSQLILCIVYYLKIFIMMLNTNNARFAKAHGIAYDPSKRQSITVDQAKSPASDGHVIVNGMN